MASGEGRHGIEFLRRQLGKTGMTQVARATPAGVSQSRLAMGLSGDRRVSRDRAALICTAWPDFADAYAADVAEVAEVSALRSAAKTAVSTGERR